MGSGPSKRSGRAPVYEGAASPRSPRQVKSSTGAAGTSGQTGSQLAPESRGGGLQIRTQQPAVKMAEKGELSAIATTTHVFVVMGASVSVERHSVSLQKR